MSNTNISLETENDIKSKKVPPDGGWGWVVVGAFSFYLLVLFPMLMNFGLIFKDKVIELQLAATDVAVIQNVCSAFGSAIGLLSAPFIKRYGCRPVAFFASIFFCSGFMLSGIANSFITFLLAYSIVTSFGIGFGWSSLYIAMISYFEVHRNKASGLSMTLAAIGPIIFPPIITMLLKFYGSEGCIWLLGAFSLNIFAAALLLQPVEWHMKRVKSIDTEMQLLNTKIVSHSNDAINDGSPHTISRQVSVPAEKEETQHSSRELRKLSLQHNVSDIIYAQPQITRKYSNGSSGSLHFGRHAEIFNEALYNRRESKRSLSQHQLNQFKINEEDLTDQNEEKRIPIAAPPSPASIEPNKKQKNIFRRLLGWLVNEFDLTLFKDVPFVITLIGITLADFSEVNLLMITPMVLDELNFDIVQVASLLSATAISDIIFRFISPFIGDLLRQSSRLMFIHGLIIFIFFRLAIVLATSYGWAMFGCILLGIGRATYTVYWNLVVPNCVEIERLPSAMGIIMVTNGFLLMAAGPIVGVLRDKTGNYTSSIHMLNFITVLAIGVWSTEIIYRRIKQNHIRRS